MTCACFAVTRLWQLPKHPQRAYRHPQRAYRIISIDSYRGKYPLVEHRSDSLAPVRENQSPAAGLFAQEQQSFIGCELE